MRAVSSFATLALLVASLSNAVPLNARQSNTVNCTGEEIVGNLVVRNPDGSTHIAAFVQGDDDNEGRLKLTTKFDGTPSPNYAQFAAQICTTTFYQYISGKRQEQQEIKTGFISPNAHRYKALTVSDTVDEESGARQLVSDYKTGNNEAFTRHTLNQWFTLYNNGSFYSLAFSGLETGPTSGPTFAPITTHSADGQDIFVEMKKSGSSVPTAGYVNQLGYALELHP